MVTRRRAREAVLQMLFQLEATQDDALAVVSSYKSSFAEGPIPDEFSITLFRSIAAEINDIDKTITSASDNWRLERMSRVDRNILRIGVFELKQGQEDTPLKIVINEAVELAKRFGAEESAAFVNGVLDRIGKEIGAAGAESAKTDAAQTDAAQTTDATETDVAETNVAKTGATD